MAAALGNRSGHDHHHPGAGDASLSEGSAGGVVWDWLSRLARDGLS